MRSTIKSIKYFGCGYCTNNLGLIFRGRKAEKRRFPAGAFLICHSKYGFILFDTGYSTDIYKAGIIGKIYNLVNPTTVEESDELSVQLKKHGVNSSNIETIILSHLHPDHIGGLKDFPYSKFVISEKVLTTYRNKRLRDLIIDNFFPTDFEKRVEVITRKMKTMKILDSIRGYDYFGDGSLILLELDGHADGQLCALINHRILLAADSCWGNDLIDISGKMKFPATIIQKNMDDYKNTLEILRKLKKEGVQLMFSHDTYDKEDLI